MHFIPSPFSETTGIVRGGRGFSLLFLLFSFFFYSVQSLWRRNSFGMESSIYHGPIRENFVLQCPPQAALPAGTALPWSMSCSSELGVSPLFASNFLLFPSLHCFLVFLKYIITKAWLPLLMGQPCPVWWVPWGAGRNLLEPSVSSTGKTLTCSQENTCLIPADLVCALLVNRKVMGDNAKRLMGVHHKKKTAFWI